MAIPQTFDEAFERAKQLVAIFSENEGKYLSPGASSACPSKLVLSDIES
jgi:hypothetical protein